MTLSGLLSSCSYRMMMTNYRLTDSSSSDESTNCLVHTDASQLLAGIILHFITFSVHNISDTVTVLQYSKHPSVSERRMKVETRLRRHSLNSKFASRQSIKSLTVRRHVQFFSYFVHFVAAAMAGGMVAQTFEFAVRLGHQNSPQSSFFRGQYVSSSNGCSSHVQIAKNFQPNKLY